MLFALQKSGAAHVSVGSFSAVLPALRKAPPLSAPPALAAVPSLDGCSSAQCHWLPYAPRQTSRMD
jgi:hypothetical protein